MKMRFLAATLSVFALSGAAAFAQADDGPPPPPQRGPGGPGGGMGFKKFIDGLSPETKKRFQEARMKALADPKIQELREKADTANKEFVDAMRAKMQEVDPGLEELIKQQGGDRREKGNRRDGEKGDRRKDKDDRDGGPGMGERGPGGGPGMANLTDAEKQKLQDARAKAKNDPAVQAAQKKKEAATTPEERRSAGEEFHQAMRAAMLKVDSSLESVLEKIAPPGPPPSPGGGPGAEAEPPPMQP